MLARQNIRPDDAGLLADLSQQLLHRAVQAHRLGGDRHAGAVVGRNRLVDGKYICAALGKNGKYRRQQARHIPGRIIWNVMILPAIIF